MADDIGTGAKWRTAFRAIAATLIVFALLTAIGWFGADHFTSGRDTQYYDAESYIAEFRKGMLAYAVVYGGMMIAHWIVAAIGGREDIRSRPADWLLGIAWLSILFCYVQTAFVFDWWWLDSICDAHPEADELARCMQAGSIVITLFVFAPFLLIVLSALIRMADRFAKWPRGL